MRNIILILVLFFSSSVVFCQTPITKIKQFDIPSPIYRNVINIIQIPNFDWKKEKIISNEGVVYFDESSSQLKVEVYLPDSMILYKVDLKTYDTIAICKKQTLKLPESESINPEISFGDINGKLVTKELLKQQTKIKLRNGYELLNATVYFIGVTESKGIRIGTLKNSDLTAFKNILDSLNDNSIISIDNVIVKTPAGRLKRTLVPTIKVGEIAQPFNFSKPRIQFGFITQSRSNYLDFKVQKKIYLTEGYVFIDAMVHFVGAGFEKPVNFNLRSLNTEPIKYLLDNCRPGTTVIFDNIRVKNKKGTIVPAEEFACALF
jgi:hypothetical protein